MSSPIKHAHLTTQNDRVLPPSSFSSKVLVTMVSCFAIAALLKRGRAAAVKLTTHSYCKTASFLPYFITAQKGADGKWKNKMFIILGNDHRNDLKDFGGYGSGERCQTYEIAALQGSQESKGIFGNRRILLERLPHCPIIRHMHVCQKFPELNNFHDLFPIEVPEGAPGTWDLPHFSEREELDVKSKIVVISAAQLLEAARAGGRVKINDTVEQLNRSFVELLEVPSTQRVFEQIEADPKTAPKLTIITTYH